ncbi:hypothetical protein [Kineosporia sp. NBRC 101731]|uniref:hypothetical protein n=1 Tax=Kineosporia sp. NBRC 101731 TaxID=3032199 RepID=UPI0024A42CD6|nr:hypothetical protein [Kineosporia sp. NBRC 101731]GLY33559.1 hypothetical protein Kisp02_69240 [Kineosporia sp. NBRC 101731]
MSTASTHIRSSHARHAPPVLRRIGAGLLASVITAVPTTLTLRAIAGESAHTNSPVSRVVESRCVDGLIRQGIDTGRPDGLLLAKTTEVSC